MAAPQMLRASYGDLFSSSALPVLEEVFWASYEEAPMKREMFAKKVVSDKDIWQYTEMGDLGAFSSVAEGADYSFSRQKQGADKTVTITKMGLGVSFSKEVLDDGKFDFMSEGIKALALSANHTQEQAVMDLLNNGFGGGTLTADGLDLFHAAHTTPGGVVTFRNKLSVNSDLSYSNLKTAIADFESVFVSDGSRKMHIPTAYLIVPSELRLYAKELIESEQGVDSTSMNINSVKGEGLQVISSNLLTDSDAWFLCAAPGQNGLRIIEREPLSIKSAGPEHVGFINDAFYVKASYREATGAFSAYGILGTPGAP